MEDSLAVRALKILPASFKDIRQSHINKIKKLFKFSGSDELDINKVNFKFHKYNNFMGKVT